MSNNTETTKSIFIQKKIIKSFLPEVNMTEKDYNCPGKYRFYIEQQESEEYGIIFAHDLPLPELKSGDKFFINSLSRLVTISSVSRTSNNETAYLIKEVVTINEGNTESLWNEIFDKIKLHIDSTLKKNEEIDDYNIKLKSLEKEKILEMKLLLRDLIITSLFKSKMRNRIEGVASYHNIKLPNDI